MAAAATPLVPMYASNAKEEEDALRDLSMGSLAEAAVIVLSEPRPFVKAAITEHAVAAWNSGSLPLLPEGGVEVPSPPWEAARPDHVELLAPGAISSRSKLERLHALVHAESCAIDLAWDVLVRFGFLRKGTADPRLPDAAGGAAIMPKQFYDDWATVAVEEADHFRSWHAQLEAAGGSYGCVPAHASLWSSARDTADSLAARLAIVHCVHEARGLDVYVNARRRLVASGDTAAVALLDRNARMEVDHVGAGVRWLRYVTAAGYDPAGLTAAQSEVGTELAGETGTDEAGREEAVAGLFVGLVRSRFRGKVKGPFHHEWRELAGMPRCWYCDDDGETMKTT